MSMDSFQRNERMCDKPYHVCAAILVSARSTMISRSFFAEFTSEQFVTTLQRVCINTLARGATKIGKYEEVSLKK